MLVLSALCTFIEFGSPACLIVLPTLRVGLLSVKAFCKCPLRHAEVYPLSSYGYKSFKLAMKVNYQSQGQALQRPACFLPCSLFPLVLSSSPFPFLLPPSLCVYIYLCLCRCGFTWLYLHLQANWLQFAICYSHNNNNSNINNYHCIFIIMIIIVTGILTDPEASSRD